jgi:hypothetical protein
MMPAGGDVYDGVQGRTAAVETGVGGIDYDGGEQLMDIEGEEGCRICSQAARQCQAEFVVNEGQNDGLAKSNQCGPQYLPRKSVHQGNADHGERYSR